MADVRLEAISKNFGGTDLKQVRVDFFLNGQMEVKKRYNDYVNSGGDVTGPYGHIIAPDVRLSEPVVIDQPVVKTLN